MTASMVIDIGLKVDSRDKADIWVEVLLLDPSLTPGAKIVGHALMAHLNHTTLQLNPSVDRLAVATCQTTRAVEKQIKALRDAGHLMWGKKGFRTSNKYTLLIPNHRREFMDRWTAIWARNNPERSAGINTEPQAGINPEQRAGVNTEQAAGIERPNTEQRAPQPRTTVRSNPERSAGGTPEVTPVLTPDRYPGVFKNPETHSWGEIGDRLNEAMKGDAFDAWFGSGKAKIDKLADGTLLITFFNPDNARRFPARLEPVLDTVLGRWEIAGRAKSRAVA